MTPHQPCWYTRRHELEPGMVFYLLDSTLVKLDQRVAGDGTRWEVATWFNGSWFYEGFEIEPGDLTGEPITRCASDNDGECTPSCPQLRDNEPHTSGRSCPLWPTGRNSDA